LKLNISRAQDQKEDQNNCEKLQQREIHDVGKKITRKHDQNHIGTVGDGTVWKKVERG
jgi:hypothetical protein